MNEYQKRILRYLNKMKRLLGHDYAYKGPTDFIMQHGVWYKPRELPSRFWKGAPMSCYGNSIIVAMMTGLRYVEGYAYTPVADEIHHHAWNIDSDGRVFDTTWVHFGGSGLAYIGVEFLWERAEEATWDGDATILNDFHRGWPILKDKWMGERLIWESMTTVQRARIAKWKSKIENTEEWSYLRATYGG